VGVERADANVLAGSCSEMQKPRRGLQPTRIEAQIADRPQVWAVPVGPRCAPPVVRVVENKLGHFLFRRYMWSSSGKAAARAAAAAAGLGVLYVLWRRSQAIAVPEAAVAALSEAKHVPPVLITAVPQELSSYHFLKSVEPEARGVQAAFGGAAGADLLLNISIQRLDAALVDRHTWCFAGHGDVVLGGELVPAFVSEDGQLQSVAITPLAEVVRRHVTAGKLQLVLFTGCCTLQLAKALQEQACVPHVVCWATKMHDGAGPAFGKAFAEALACGSEPQVAFDAACAAVEEVTEPGHSDTGVAGEVAKFQLFVDPDNPALVHPLEGVENAGRLRSFAAMAEKGRLAAGIPVLLDGSAPELASVPSAAPHLGGSVEYVTREAEQQRASGLLLDALSGVSLMGQGGVGKTILAAAIVNNRPVRSYFRDGMVSPEVVLTDVRLPCERLRARACALRSSGSPSV
jgi:hypothetical protein